MSDKSLFKKESVITHENLHEAIQQAIEIEIATIPVYLYTYYTINRVPDQDAISGALYRDLVGQGAEPAEARSTALCLSAKIMVFANKAGALIMSVAIEEMLHMALSSNLKQALAGLPLLVGKSPATWPAYLAGHEPEFPIDKDRFSLDQLMTFLKIESPDPLPDPKLLKSAIHYKTIGEFYQMIVDYLDSPDQPLEFRTDPDKYPQLVPGRGYYAQNNIDTTFYDIHHKAKLVNTENTKKDPKDAGDLVQVVDLASAKEAIKIIVDQGEGNKAIGFGPDYLVDCSAIIPAGDYDDKNQQELCHFEKFAQIYCEYKHLNNEFNSLGIGKIDISDYFVENVPLNPVTEDYPEKLQSISNLLNAVYTYIFVMSEACYKKSGNTQYEIFMFGIHKSMIFILNSLCGDIMKYTFVSKKDNKTYKAAPTFEDYPFGLKSSPRAQLIALHAAATANYPNLSYLAQRFQDLPDVAL